MNNILCIFAHPDDESFGPGGTIAKLALTNDVYIICVTDGGAGHTKSVEDIVEVRKNELLAGAKILGVREVFFLGFKDGDLSNNLYHEVASRIKAKVMELKPQTIITFEPRGISGHIDHIATTFITNYVTQKLDFVKKIMYHCISDTMRKLIPDYFIYFPEGYSEAEIDEVVDVSEVWDKKIEAIKAHVSQKKDGDFLLNMANKLPKKEYFLIASRG